MEEPTRKDNVLDLILTNRPNKVLRVDVLPGVSDHDIVFTELDMRPVKQKQKPRKIPIYRKAEWEPMKEDMKSLHKDMEAIITLRQQEQMRCGKSLETHCSTV